MPAVYEYAMVRVVPRVEREEFVNVGVIVSCPPRDFLACRFDDDLDRLAALAPDLDLRPIRAHIEALRRVCEGAPGAGAVANLPPRERFHWLTHPRSTVLQVSRVHAGRGDDLPSTLARLYTELVETGE